MPGKEAYLASSLFRGFFYFAILRGSISQSLKKILNTGNC